MFEQRDTRNHPGRTVQARNSPKTPRHLEKLFMKAPLFVYLPMALTLISAGCATTSETMIKQGFPPAYAQGFDDGCHSGHKAGGNMFEQFKKDVVRFEQDKAYASGWSDAFRQCESQQENATRQTRMAIEQENLRQLREQNKLNQQHALEKQVLKGVDTSGLQRLKE